MKIGDLVKCINTNFYGIIIDCDDLKASIKDFCVHWIGSDFDWRYETELEVIHADR